MSSPWGAAADLASRVKRPQKITLAGHVIAAGFLVLALKDIPSSSHVNWYHIANLLFAEGGSLIGASLYSKIDENTRVTVAAAADVISAARQAPPLDVTTTSAPVARELVRRETKGGAG